MVRELHEVVYVLVEIRKLLEFNNAKSHHESLVFHCDWALHSELRGSQAQAIVRLFDKLMDTENYNPATNIEHPKLIEELVDITTMSRFREALKKFLIEYGIPTSIVEYDPLWNEFVTGYLMVVEACPLKCISQGLKNLESVTLAVTNIKGPYDASITDNVRAQLNWQWTFIDGDVQHELVTFIKDVPLSELPQP
jgi:hypothetical protein